MTAARFLDRIKHAIDIGGWTRSEWRRLRLLEMKWGARAEGVDPRFNEVGNRKGGLSAERAVKVGDKKVTMNMKMVLATEMKKFRAYKSNGD